jgi:hypothetical protein
MHITSLETFEELHCLIYCAAVAVLRTMGARILSSSQNKTCSKYTPQSIPLCGVDEEGLLLMQS